MKKKTFIDLFAGCGGFSEGFYQEGYDSLLHVDYDEAACDTLRERMRHYEYSNSEIEKRVLCGDLTSQAIHNKISEIIGNDNVDLIVGGPPCQSFSSVGRAQDPNSMKNDPRNYLFKSYLEILERYLPKVFFFFNVSGLLTAKPGGNPIFPEIIESMQNLYNVCDKKDLILLNSVHYGVPQIRKRVILIGVRKDLEFTPEEIYNSIEKTHFCPEMESKGVDNNLKKYRTISEAINDLPKLLPGEGSDEVDVKVYKSNEYLKDISKKPVKKILNHVARNHNILDQERYEILSKNDWQLKDLQKIRPDLIHHDPKHFGNRYTVQSYDKPGKTVVAHLYKDGNLFIHPDFKQKRTFTVREAARVQSFPDDFKFVGSRTNQYKQVGNAVPPLMARQIAKAIKKFI